MRTDVLGVGFDDLTLEEAVEAGAGLVEAEGFHYAVTPNPEFLLAARKNPEFRQALLGADLVLADGIGVIYSAKILGRPLKGKVPGIDFAQRLLAWMANHGKRLFLLGAKPGVAELAAANLNDGANRRDRRVSVDASMTAMSRLTWARSSGPSLATSRLRSTSTALAVATLTSRGSSSSSPSPGSPGDTTGMCRTITVGGGRRPGRTVRPEKYAAKQRS